MNEAISGVILSYCVDFKTDPEYFNDEKYDNTPGTIREFKPNMFDKRKVLLDRFMKGEIDKLSIKITNSVETEKVFKREVSGVKIFKGLYCIYWRTL